MPKINLNWAELRSRESPLVSPIEQSKAKLWVEMAMFGLIENTFGGDPRLHRQKIGGAWGGYAKTNDAQASGLVAGTRIATAMGWRPVEAIAPGDSILTFDGGHLPVRDVIRGTLWRDATQCPQALWPLLVPADAIGNAQPMMLLPEQAALVESDTADLILDDPFAALPAASLAGFRGIERVAPQAEISVIQLVFDADEVVFAAGGALVLCPALRHVDIDALTDPEAGAVRYRALSGDEAALLVDCLHEEDANRHSADRAQVGAHAA